MFEDFTEREYVKFIAPAIKQWYQDRADAENNTQDMHKADMFLEYRFEKDAGFIDEFSIGWTDEDDAPLMRPFNHDYDKIPDYFERLPVSFHIGYEEVIHDDEGYRGKYEGDYLSAIVTRTEKEVVVHAISLAYDADKLLEGVE